MSLLDPGTRTGLDRAEAWARLPARRGGRALPRALAGEFRRAHPRPAPRAAWPARYERLACTYRGCLRALIRTGVPYELVTYPNEGRGVWKTTNRADLLRRMARLFDEAFAAA